MRVCAHVHICMCVCVGVNLRRCLSLRPACHVVHQSGSFTAVLFHPLFPLAIWWHNSLTPPYGTCQRSGSTCVCYVTQCHIFVKRPETGSGGIKISQLKYYGGGGWGGGGVLFYTSSAESWPECRTKHSILLCIECYTLRLMFSGFCDINVNITLNIFSLENHVDPDSMPT